MLWVLGLGHETSGPRNKDVTSGPGRCSLRSDNCFQFSEKWIWKLALFSFQKTWQKCKQIWASTFCTVCGLELSKINGWCELEAYSSVFAGKTSALDTLQHLQYIHSPLGVSSALHGQQIASIEVPPKQGGGAGTDANLRWHFNSPKPKRVPAFSLPLSLEVKGRRCLVVSVSDGIKSKTKFGRIV